VRGARAGRRRALALAALVAGVAGCASAPDPADKPAYAEYEARNDPIEPFNRGVYRFNRAIDALFLKPAAGFYRALTPPPVRKAVTNVLTNLKSPVVLANDLLQGEWERAGETSARFAINSTIGVGGILDMAKSQFGIDRHGEDFGQTLAVWGVPEGPFLMLPVIGPSSPRDAVGLAVDSFVLDPIAWWGRIKADDRSVYVYSRLGMTVIDERAGADEALDDIEKNSLDPYAALRSLFRQYRAKEIGQGRATAPADLPDFDDIPDAEDEPPPGG
jgi:phospholipid-binding lipoprotein MlaA